MNIHCPRCQGTFRVDGEESGAGFDCPYCKVGFSFRDRQTVVLRDSPETRVEVRHEDSAPATPAPVANADSPAAPARSAETPRPDTGLETMAAPPPGERRVQPSIDSITDLEVGDRLDGYRLDDVVGAGGMSVVFRARQLSLNRDVALKVLRKDLGDDPQFSRRFQKEAQALAELTHPSIVRVYDQGVHEGQYYLVMELVDGVSLRDILSERRLTPAEALKLVPPLCAGLEFAHQNGIVHRDIKPENILVDRDGNPRIADFGLARMLGEEAEEVSRLTGTQTILGTLEYMSPEQREGGRDIDHRSDIYSLGVVLYEMLTGELPIARFPLPSEKVQVDVRLDEVVVKVLAKDRDRRYQRVSQVADDLASIESGSFRREDGLHPREFGPRLLAMGQTSGFILMSALFVILCIIGGDATRAFITGAIIPFYACQFVLHGLLARPVMTRSGFLYKHPLIAGGLIGFVGYKVIDQLRAPDEIGVALLGLCVSAGICAARHKAQVFRQVGEPKILTPPHVAEALGRTIEESPRKKGPVEAHVEKHVQAADRMVRAAVATGKAAAEGAQAAAGAAPEAAAATPAGAAQQPAQDTGPKRKRFSLLVLLGFLVSVLTLLVSVLLLVAACGQAENVLWFSTPGFTDVRQALLEIWNAPDGWLDSVVTAAYVIGLAPFLVAGAINLLAFVRLAVGGVRGGALFMVTCLLLFVQMILGLEAAVVAHNRVDEYRSILDGYVGPSTDSMPTFNWEFDNDPLHRLAWYHRIYRLHPSVEILEGPEPLIAQASMPQLSQLERQATLVLITELYRNHLHETGATPKWVGTMVGQLGEGMDRGLRLGYLDALSGYGDPRLEPYYLQAVHAYANHTELRAAARWLPVHASAEARNRLFANLRAMSSSDALYMLLHCERMDGWPGNEAWREMILDPLSKHPEAQVRERAEALQQSTGRQL